MVGSTRRQAARSCCKALAGGEGLASGSSVGLIGDDDVIAENILAEEGGLFAVHVGFAREVS
jgi:hypothetical protein